MIENMEITRQIEDYINAYFSLNNALPTVKDISIHINRAKSTTHKYLTYMQENNQLIFNNQFDRYMTTSISNSLNGIKQVAVVGDIACGSPLLAEENITDHFAISSSMLGQGEFFALKAKGNSMINAGINNGDFVIIRKQNTAEEGQIIVALIDNEATLKRFYLDKERKQVRLHPENDEMDDMYFDNIEIQGIVKKVLKEIN